MSSRDAHFVLFGEQRAFGVALASHRGRFWPPASVVAQLVIERGTWFRKLSQRRRARRCTGEKASHLGRPKKGPGEKFSLKLWQGG
jgi:hypothetical protein